MLFILAELSLVLRVPLPSILPWSVVSVVGAATVLSYAIIADYFPDRNRRPCQWCFEPLHFGWAFACNTESGSSSDNGRLQDGHYPMIAYQAAFGLNLTIQATALIWFALPWLRNFVPVTRPDVQVNFASAMAEGPILEPSLVVDW